MVYCYIKHLTNCTQNIMYISKIVVLCARPNYVKQVKTCDVLNYLGLKSLKFLKLNLDS